MHRILRTHMLRCTKDGGNVFMLLHRHHLQPHMYIAARLPVPKAMLMLVTTTIMAV